MGQRSTREMSMASDVRSAGQKAAEGYRGKKRKGHIKDETEKD